MVMSKRVSVAEAKSQLSSCIREAEAGHPVLITRHGKPVVAIVSAAELDHLRRFLAKLSVGVHERERRRRMRSG